MADKHREQDDMGSWLGVLPWLGVTPGLAAEGAGPPPPGQDAEALAKAAQNPIANLISVPLQNDTGFNFGPRKRTQNILSIQPVVPFKLTDDWNLITRTIALQLLFPK